MRSLPPPRYSRTRIIQRIFRSIINLFSTGYISDSSAYSHHAVLNKSSHRTRIRKSRITGKPTPRTTMLTRLISKLFAFMIDDQSLISNVVRTDLVQLTNDIGAGGKVAVNDVKRYPRNKVFTLWKRGEQSDIKF